MRVQATSLRRRRARSPDAGAADPEIAGLDARAARARRARPARRVHERPARSPRAPRAALAVRPRAQRRLAGLAGRPPGGPRRGHHRGQLPDAHADHGRELRWRCCSPRARCPGALLWATIVAAHLALLLGPPLISQDVFGYLDFARLGALHGLDPYTHVAAQAPTDPAYLFVGWPFQHSPYGPLFTLASYAIAPLGLGRRAVGVEGARGRLQPRRDRAGRARGRRRDGPLARASPPPSWA